jgi:hypothetical protein
MTPKLSIALIGLVCLMGCSSREDEFEIKESDVPLNVVAALKAKYPTAAVKKWEAEKEGDRFYFEAEITMGNEKKDIRITSDGSELTEEKD